MRDDALDVIGEIASRLRLHSMWKDEQAALYMARQLLKDERAAAAKDREDAERYVWLRDALANDDMRSLEILISQDEPKTADEFDAAIDAARSQP